MTRTFGMRIALLAGVLAGITVTPISIAPASGAAEVGSQSGVFVDLNKGVWVHGPDLPDGRQDAAVAVMDGRIYLVGGFGPHSEQESTLLVLEPTFPSPEAKPGVAGPIISHPGEWRYASTMPEPVDHAAAAAMGGYLYVAGGRIEDLVTNKFWRYDPINDEWTELPSMPFPRYGPVMQAVNGKLYLLGGQSSHGNDERSMLIFDPTTNQWTSKDYALGSERFLAGSVVIDNKIYVVGGTDRSQDALTSCDVYDPASERWRTCTDMRTGRADFGLASVNNRLMAIGGEGYSNFDGASANNPFVAIGGGNYGATPAPPGSSIPEFTNNGTLVPGSARGSSTGTFSGDVSYIARRVTQTTEISSSDALGWMSGPWLPYPRQGMAVVALGNQIWVIGGSPYMGTAPLTSVLRFVSPVTQIQFKGHAPH